jgi:hypothetical protein
LSLYLWKEGCLASSGRLAVDNEIWAIKLVINKFSVDFYDIGTHLCNNVITFMKQINNKTSFLLIKKLIKIDDIFINIPQRERDKEKDRKREWELCLFMCEKVFSLTQKQHH